MIGNRLRIVGLALLSIGFVAGEVQADAGAEVRATSRDFVEAFNTGDAAAVAKLWTTDGQLVDASGRVLKGRDEIESAYKKFFADHPGEKIDVSIDSINLLSDDAALEQGSAMLEAAKSDGPSSGGKYTAVHVKEGGKWLMAFVHESTAASSNTSNPLKDLDWLVGEWTGEEYGATTTIKCQWLPNRSFLERAFKVVTPDKHTIAGVQLVGIDPRTGYITSWNFNFDGSHAVATWVPTPGGWTINTVGLRPDGAETHAINLLTKLDENAYSWRSLQRSIGMESLPDTGEVVLKRAEAKKPAGK